MTTRRIAKIERAIREAISTAVLFELRDPRVQNVTILRIQVSPDLLAAKVYVSVLGDEKQQSLTLHGLNSARGFLQKKVAERIQTRYTPILRFELDQSVKMGAEAARILRDLNLDNQDSSDSNDSPDNDPESIDSSESVHEPEDS